MKMKTKWVGAFFLFVLFAMFIRAAAVYVPLGSAFLRQEFSELEPSFDALAAYPYAGTDDPDGEASTGPDLPALRAYAAFERLKSLVVDYMRPERGHFMEFVIGKRLIDKAMGLDMTASSSAGEDDPYAVGIWRDDYLGYAMPDADNASIYESVAAFGKRMEEEGRNFLYFMVPAKQTSTIAYPDHSEKRRRQLLQALREQELDVIDAMDVIAERRMDMEDLFFKTDHHWLPSTAIWADRILCEFMSENYGYHIDISVFDPENYETAVIEDAFLGFMGRKVTTAYCSKEDFPIVMPKYDTDLEVFISGENRISTGSIQDTLFDYECLEASVSDPYGNDAYNFYMYADRAALVTVHNNGIHDGSRVLIIKTSFANTMVPYLSAVVEDLYVLDITQFDGSPRTFIDEMEPDTVIIVAGTDRLGDFDFFDAAGK